MLTTRKVIMKSFALIRYVLCVCFLAVSAAGTPAVADDAAAENPSASGVVAQEPDPGGLVGGHQGDAGQTPGDGQVVDGETEPEPEPEPFSEKELLLPPKSVEITGRYCMGVMTDASRELTDRFITALVREAGKRWNVPVCQIGWYAEGKKPGQGIVALGQYEEDGNVSIKRAATKEEALLLEKSLCYPTTPGKLSREYLTNEVVADEDYRGKCVLFSSVISEIARGAFNKPYVFFPSEEGSYTGLTCYFAGNDPNLRKIRKGSVVTVRGTVKGFLMQDVLLERCDILEVLTR